MIYRLRIVWYCWAKCTCKYVYTRATCHTQRFDLKVFKWLFTNFSRKQFDTRLCQIENVPPCTQEKRAHQYLFWYACLSSLKWPLGCRWSVALQPTQKLIRSLLEVIIFPNLPQSCESENFSNAAMTELFTQISAISLSPCNKLLLSWCRAVYIELCSYCLMTTLSGAIKMSTVQCDTQYADHQAYRDRLLCYLCPIIIMLELFIPAVDAPRRCDSHCVKSQNRASSLDFLAELVELAMKCHNAANIECYGNGLLIAHCAADEIDRVCCSYYMFHEYTNFDINSAYCQIQHQ